MLVVPILLEMAQSEKLSAQPWHTLEGRELASKLTDITRRLFEESGPRLSRYRANAARYERAARTRLTRGVDQSSDQDLQRFISNRGLGIWNIGASIVDGSSNHIAGSSQPRIQVCTSRASWSVKRRGVWIERTLDAEWQLPKWPFADLWDLTGTQLRNTALFGTCGSRAIAIANSKQPQVVYEIVPPWQLVYDNLDGASGNPSTTIQCFPVDVGSVTERFTDPGKKRAIESASTPLEPWGYLDGPPTILQEGETRDHCLLIEAWHNATADQPGRHVVMLWGADDVLVSEPYRYREPPIELMHWRRPIEGMFATGIMDDVAVGDDVLNELMDRMVQAIKMTGINRTWVDQNTIIDSGTMEALRGNEDSTLMFYQSVNGSGPPKSEQMASFHPQMQEFVLLLKQGIHDLSGASQMMVTAQKTPGVEANAALLTLKDMQSDRFGFASRAYQNIHVRLARWHVRCQQEISQKVPGYKVRYRAHGRFDEIDWSSVDIDDNQYELEIQAASTQKGSAAWRMQVAQNLFQMGKLSADDLLEIQRTKDLDGAVDAANTTDRRIERMIERIFDATPKQLAQGYLDEKHERPILDRPDPFMELPRAIVLVYRAYEEALLEEAPELVQETLLGWLDVADKEQKKRQAQQAPPPGMPAQPPPPQPPGPTP